MDIAFVSLKSEGLKQTSMHVIGHQGVFPVVAKSFSIPQKLIFKDEGMLFGS